MNITEDTAWYAAGQTILLEGLVFVDGAPPTIEPGVKSSASIASPSGARLAPPAAAAAAALGMVEADAEAGRAATSPRDAGGFGRRAYACADRATSGDAFEGMLLLLLLLLLLRR